MAELRWGAATHEGRLRNQNEDHHHVSDGLFVVADGMGGHLAGEIASEMAVTQMRARLLDDAPVTLDAVVASIDAANREIYTGSLENADQAGMGTTVTAIAVIDDPLDGEVFAIANVGDSRGYVLRHARLRQLTIDHSFVQELVAEGAITRDEARTHPRRNIVTRALGIEPTVRVDSWTMPIFQGDRLLLCSDGLVDEVADPDIAEVLLEFGDDPQAAAQALVDAANAAGGRDNITVVVVDVLKGDEPPDPTEEFDVVPLWADDDLERTGETQIISDPPDDDWHALADGTTEADDDAATDAATDDALPGEGAALITAAAVVDSEPEIANGDLLVGGVGADVEGETADGADDSIDGRADVVLAPGVEPTLPPPDHAAAPVAPTPRRKRSKTAGLARFILVVGVAAVIVLGCAILAAWARSGYFVAFDDDGRVAIYQGREFLWFEPTVEAYGQYDRDELTSESVALVEDELHFESQDSAAVFVAERLHPLTDEDEPSAEAEP